jgi:hypothetical protein
MRGRGYAEISKSGTETKKVTVSDGHFLKLPLGLKKQKKTPYREVLVLPVTDCHSSA